MSHSYAPSTQPTEGAFLQHNPNGFTMGDFEIAAHQAALNSSSFQSYHTREASGYYPKGALNAVEDQDLGQSSLERRPSVPRRQVPVTGSSTLPAATAVMTAPNQSFASMGMDSATTSAIGNGLANQTGYGASHRPGLRVNVPRTNAHIGPAALAANGLSLIDSSDANLSLANLGLDTFLHPNTTPEATLERANNNDTSHHPGALSPLSAFSPASGGPHSPSANQFPPPSPFANSPHSPYPVSPEGHLSSGAISPALPLPVPSPASLSPQFGPMGSNVSPRLPMRPLKGHAPSRSQTQPIGDDGLKSHSLVGKSRGKSPATRSNTGTVAPTHGAFSYSILDPFIQGQSITGITHSSGASTHQRMPSLGHKPNPATGLVRSPSGGMSKRNHGVEDRFYRNRGHSVGNAAKMENVTHPYLSQRYEGSVVAQAGSVRGQETGSLSGSRSASPFIGSSPLPPGLELPGGMALSASNLAMMNASYGDGNTLAPPISVEGAPSRRGSGSSLGDINGPLGANQLSDNEYHLDTSLASQLLAPPSTSPHSPHFGFGSPHSPHLEIPYMGSPSAHQLPPPSPLDLPSGASSPAQILSPWGTHHSSPAFIAVGSDPNGLGLANAGGFDVPQFQDLGHGLLSSSPPFAEALAQELSTLDAEQAHGVARNQSLHGFQNQQLLMDKLAQEDAMMIDNATAGGNIRDQNGGMNLGFDGVPGNVNAASVTGLSGIHLIPSPMAAGLQLPAQGAHTPEYAMGSLPGQSFNYTSQGPQQQAYDIQNALSLDPNISAMNPTSFGDLSSPSQVVTDAEGRYIPPTVPPTPSTGVILPWNTGMAVMPGGNQQWQEQQVVASQVLQPDATASGAQTPNTLSVPKVGRPPAPVRRRSYSTYDQPMPGPPVVSAHEPMDDVYLGNDGLLKRKNASASAGLISAHKRARSFNPPPTINVTNWDSRPSPSAIPVGGHGQPPIPLFVQSRPLSSGPEAHIPSSSHMNSHYDARQQMPASMLLSQNGSLALNDAYPPRISSAATPIRSGSTLVSPPLLTSSSSSSSAPSTPVKVRQQGQRHEVNEEMLRKAFSPETDYPNPGLRALLELIRRSPFYLNETMEPMLGTAEAEHLLEHVRRIVPNDPRFVSRLTENGDPGLVGVGGVGNGNGDSASRDAQSIYMLFTESNQCLICGKQTDRSGRALGHVRSDIGHRPYHCGCEKCAASNNPRKFFSENLLDDHLKGQVVKQECQVCHNFFRRGGMKRHMNSKHPEVLYKQSGEDGDED